MKSLTRLIAKAYLNNRLARTEIIDWDGTLQDYANQNGYIYDEARGVVIRFYGKVKLGENEYIERETLVSYAPNAA